MTTVDVLDRSASVVTVDSSNLNASLYSFSVPGSTLTPSTPRQLRANLCGKVFNNHLTGDRLDLYVALGGTVLYDGHWFAPTKDADFSLWELDIEIEPDGTGIITAGPGICTIKSLVSAPVVPSGGSGTESLYENTLNRVAIGGSMASPNINWFGANALNIIATLSVGNANFWMDKRYAILTVA